MIARTVEVDADFSTNIIEASADIIGCVTGSVILDGSISCSDDGNANITITEVEHE